MTGYDTGDRRDATSLIAAGESNLSESHRPNDVVNSTSFIVSRICVFRNRSKYSTLQTQNL